MSTDRFDTVSGFFVRRFLIIVNNLLALKPRLFLLSAIPTNLDIFQF